MPTNSMTIQQYRQMQKYKDPRRQLQGKVNRDIGKEFENLIDSACLYYQKTGKAEIEKTPEAMKVLQSLGGGRFVACFEKKAQPDYKGSLNGGKTIVFDAKHTVAAQIEQSRVTLEQAKTLDRHYSMGASCFVVVGFNMSSFYRIPWEVWRDMKGFFGRKYVKPEELGDYRIALGNNGVLLFLD